MTISDVLRKGASRWGEMVAITETKRGMDRSITFAELADASERVARRMFRLGLRRHDAILVFVPMSIALYETLLGIFRLGAVAVFVDPWAGPGHLARCCARMNPKALVAGTGLRVAAKVLPALRSIPLALSPGASVEDQSAVEVPPPQPDDPALVTFTSGSTGTPKAAVRTHAFLIAQHRALAPTLDLQPGEIDLTTLPVFVLANLASGVTSVLPDADMRHPGRVDPDRILPQIGRNRPTRSAGSPAFFGRLASTPTGLAAFKKIFVGGAPVFPAFFKSLHRRTLESPVIVVYGSTEAEPIAHVAFHEVAQEDWHAMRAGRGLLVGRVVSEISLRIIPDQWGECVGEFSERGPGEVGEILVTGDHVLKGYLDGVGDEETKVSRDGVVWHRTGDAGYRDGDGRLWLMGRCAAKISDPDGVLYPFAVEGVAMAFPEIRRAALFAKSGQRCLALECDSADSVDDVRAALPWAKIARYKVVRHIPVDPRHNAKVNYPALRRKFWW